MKKYFVLGGMLLSLLIINPAQADNQEITADATSTPPVVEIVTESTTTVEIAPTSTIVSDPILETTPTSTVEVPTTTIEIISTSTPEVSTTTSDNISTTTLEIPAAVVVDNTPTTTPESISSGTPTTNNQTVPKLFTSDQISETVIRINNFLKSQQSTDGTIEDGTATDWAIMSLGATGQYANDIKNGSISLLGYEENYSLNDPKTINICAGYPRHILAFLAAGIEKTHPSITDLRTKTISECYKNNTYGEYGINDDVFALLALLPTGSNINDEIIKDIINAIKADQTSDGAFTFAGWAGADMTGAAINALKFAENNGAIIDSQIYTRAKQYLKTNQLTDGGWGYGASDVLTTSWAIMGINSLGEAQSHWINSSEKNPWNVLIDNNKIDGSYESAWSPGTTDWFALQSAAPALLGKTWPIILTAKPQEFHYSGGGCGNCQPITEILITTSTPTSTVEIATSTIETVTSTIETILAPTSTALISNQISTTTQEISPIKKKLSKKIIKKNLKLIKNNNVAIATSTSNTSNDEPKKSSLAQIISSSKNGIINFGHTLLKLLRNVL